MYMPPLGDFYLCERLRNTYELQILVQLHHHLLTLGRTCKFIRGEGGENPSPEFLIWILGLGESKGRWVMEQDFHGDFQVLVTWFFASFSGVLD